MKFSAWTSWFALMLSIALATTACSSTKVAEGTSGASSGTGASSSTGASGSGGSGGGPDLQCHPLPADHAALGSFFSQYMNVFGVHLFGTASTPCAKMQHAAGVMAQYLDNDENGEVDDPLVLQSMVEVQAALVMFATEEEIESVDPGEIFSLPYAFQDLYGSETHPEGSSVNTGFDATLEEVLHLVSDKGYARAYPSRLGVNTGTELTKAMDIARGGQFFRIPKPYPAEAWYHYGDATCDYACMATEYIYWSLTSVLGAQEYAGRPEEIANEWELYTEALVKETDLAVYALLTDPALKLPTQLPDGKYSPTP